MSDMKSVQAVESVEENIITLSTGVVLRAKPAAIVSVISVLAAYPQPRPPIVRNTLIGMDIENFEDPDYADRVKVWKTEQTNAVLTAFILSGTELISFPKKFFGPESNEFIEEFSLLGLPMRPDNKRWRYLTWVKHYACVDRDDLTLIQEVVGRLSGVSKVDVRAAEEFHGSEETSR